MRLQSGFRETGGWVRFLEPLLYAAFVVCLFL